ncbi:MAG: hypothetical protein H7A12_00390 [Pseudomonadales bacterium]|jgi:hypothetical protein|nr:hypothetical protein [Pseudomonadales bacterium]
MHHSNNRLSVAAVRLLRIAIIPAFLAYGAPHANSGEDRSHENERLLLAEKIEHLLIASGACESAKTCRERQLVFVSPATNGVAISTYGIDDPFILRKILEESAIFFYTYKQISIEIEHFAFTKSDDLKSFFKAGKPLINIKMERPTQQIDRLMNMRNHPAQVRLAKGEIR